MSSIFTYRVFQVFLIFRKGYLEEHSPSKGSLNWSLSQRSLRRGRGMSRKSVPLLCSWADKCTCPDTRSRTLSQKARWEVRALRERTGPLLRNSHSTKPFLTHLISCNPDKAGNVIPIHLKLSFRQFVIYPRSHRMTDLGFKARCVKPWFSTATLCCTLHYILEVIKPSPDVA